MLQQLGTLTGTWLYKMVMRGYVMRANKIRLKYCRGAASHKVVIFYWTDRLAGFSTVHSVVTLIDSTALVMAVNTVLDGFSSSPVVYYLRSLCMDMHDPLTSVLYLQALCCDGTLIYNTPGRAPGRLGDQLSNNDAVSCTTPDATSIYQTIIVPCQLNREAQLRCSCCSNNR